jgi:hypothetical protein
MGERIIVTGRVLDEDGTRSRARWSRSGSATRPAATSTRRTSTPRRSTPTSSAPGKAVTDEDGSYRFLTIKPGAYPWRNHPNAWRPAHIHFSLFGPAFVTRLITQMYFPGDPLHELDPIMGGVPREHWPRMIAGYDHDHRGGVGARLPLRHRAARSGGDAVRADRRRRVGMSGGSRPSTPADAVADRRPVLPRRADARRRRRPRPRGRGRATDRRHGRRPRRRGRGRQRRDGRDLAVRRRRPLPPPRRRSRRDVPTLHRLRRVASSRRRHLPRRTVHARHRARAGTARCRRPTSTSTSSPAACSTSCRRASTSRASRPTTTTRCSARCPPSGGARCSPDPTARRTATRAVPVRHRPAGRGRDRLLRRLGACRGRDPALRDAIAAHVRRRRGRDGGVHPPDPLRGRARDHPPGRRDLTLVRMTPDLIYDQLIGAGCARKLVFSWGGNPGVGSLHRFRDAVEHGWPRRSRSRSTATRRWRTPSTRAPPGCRSRPARLRRLGPARRVNPNIRTVTCPFTGEELAAVPPSPRRRDRPRAAGRPRRQRADRGHRRGAEGGGARRARSSSRSRRSSTTSRPRARTP